MIRFACGHCKCTLSAPVECAGRVARCRYCGRVIIVPDAPRPLSRIEAVVFNPLWIIAAIMAMVLAYAVWRGMLADVREEMKREDAKKQYQREW